MSCTCACTHCYMYMYTCTYTYMHQYSIEKLATHEQVVVDSQQKGFNWCLATSLMKECCWLSALVDLQDYGIMLHYIACICLASPGPPPQSVSQIMWKSNNGLHKLHTLPQSGGSREMGYITQASSYLYCSQHAYTVILFVLSVNLKHLQPASWYSLVQHAAINTLYYYSRYAYCSCLSLPCLEPHLTSIIINNCY
jgi:hypothetical protein